MHLEWLISRCTCVSQASRSSPLGAGAESRTAAPSSRRVGLPEDHDDDDDDGASLENRGASSATPRGDSQPLLPRLSSPLLSSPVRAPYNSSSTTQETILSKSWSFDQVPSRFRLPPSRPTETGQRR